MAAVSKDGKVKKYEYLDHTADVQLHAYNINMDELQAKNHIQKGFEIGKHYAGGDDLKEAFEQVGIAMFGYMTELDTVDIVKEQTIEAEGEDMMSLLFHFLDESLFLMCCDPYFIVKDIEIIEFDRENFKIKAVERGEEFDLDKHPQGTEVKAITYSNMQIHDNEDRHEVFVIIDI